MPEFALDVTGPPVAAVIQPSFMLLGDAGTKVTAPFGPVPIDYSTISDSWTTLDRQGRTPLLIPATKSLPQMQFNLTLARPDNQDDVETLLAQFRAAAVSGERYTVSYGPQESGLWRIVDMSFSVTARQEGTNLATQATMSVTLRRVSDTTKVGPVTGGTGPKPPTGGTTTPPKTGSGGTPVVTPPKKPTPAPAPAPSTRTYRVVSGDTLWALAARFLGNPLRWPEIARLNAIKDPRLLRAGAVIRLPAR